MKLSLRLRIAIIVIVTLLVWSHITWGYFHEGIPIHYIFHSKDMPGIPNWLGGILLPFFTWFLLYRIHKRTDGLDLPVASESLRSVILRFFLAALISITIAICFSLKIDIIDYVMYTIFLLAFIFPLYKSEYLLGWVIGSSFTFGAMIPMSFGSLLALVFFIFYKISRFVIGFFDTKRK